MSRNQSALARSVGTVLQSLFEVLEERRMLAGNPPVAVDDNYAATEDVALTVDAVTGVLANDTDDEGDPLTAVVVTPPANGTLSLASDGSFVYTPNANFSGVDTFTYLANDGDSDSGAPATVMITVAAVNDVPAAVDDSYQTAVDAVLTVPAGTGLLANDSDAEGDAMTAAVVAGPTNGTLVLEEDGSFTYTPNNGFNGTDSFTYNVSDAGGTGNTATVTIVVNNNPVANDDAATTDEDTPLVVTAPGVLGNDTDVNSGALLTASLVTGPTNGTLTLDPDGAYTYTPNADFVGTDTFTYQVSDGLGTSNVATVTITVTNTNDAPDSVDDAYATNEDAPLVVSVGNGVLANDTDPDGGDALTAVLVAGPSNGTLTLNADGSFSYNPNANFTGTDSFTYRSNDGEADGDVATVTITVNAVNDLPDSVDDAYSTAEDTPLVVDAVTGVLANDADEEGDALTAVIVTQPANGSVTLNADGSFTYTPNANFNGTDTFTYRAADADEGDVATVTITVTAVNDAPAAVDDSYQTGVDAELAVSVGNGVLANDSDAEGDAITATIVAPPTNGTVVLAADGSFVYTPNPGFRGTDMFTYEVSDGSLTGNTATVTVVVNDAPLGVSDSYETVEETPLVIDAVTGVLANDSDPNADPITAVIETQPANGTVTLNADGSFTYTPNANFAGVDTFTYRVDDGLLQSAPVTVSVTVTDTQDPPDAVDDAYATNEDAPLVVSVGGGVLANDTDPDPGATLTVTLGAGPTNGSVTLNADGSFTYTPNANFNGTDTFTYTVTDGTDSDTATVTITVNAVNDLPDSVDDAYAATEDTPLVIDAANGVLANDTDVEGDALTAVIVTQPTKGTVTLNADGSFTYTPNANATGVDTFTYRAADADEGDVATVTITIANTNDAPTAVNDAYSTTVGTALVVNAANGVLVNDTDPDAGDTLTAAVVSQPLNGTLTLNANGSFTYTPNPLFSGTDTFTYRVHDGTGDGNVATVTIAVTGVPTGSNIAPTAENVTVLRNPGSTIRIKLGDRVNDADGDRLTITILTQPKNGRAVVNQRGTASTADDYVEYIPNAGFHGDDSFVYRVSDGKGGTDTAKVTVKARTVGLTVNANGKSDLYVIGSNGNDNIRLVRAGNGIRVVRNGKVVGTFRPSGTVIVKGARGNDRVDVSGIGRTAFLYGGGGNDHLIGGGRLNYLFGGAGDDEIVRGTVRDLVIGGPGNNTLA